MKVVPGEGQEAWSSWGIAGLPSLGPDPGLGGKLDLFGQFVGDWDIVEQTFPLTDRKKTKRMGEAHFNWILGGRAIQDVWGLSTSPPISSSLSAQPFDSTMSYSAPGEALGYLSFRVRSECSLAGKWEAR